MDYNLHKDKYNLLSYYLINAERAFFARHKLVKQNQNSAPYASL